LAGRDRLFADPGTLWHLVVGEDILRSGHLIRTDHYSATFADQPWIAQWWLGECALALLRRLGGLDAVAVATAALVAALFAWLGGRLRRGGMHPLLAVLVL